MTMPHLMNCQHSYDGWCLACVKELWRQTPDGRKEARAAATYRFGPDIDMAADEERRFGKYLDYPEGGEPLFTVGKAGGGWLLFSMEKGSLGHQEFRKKFCAAIHELVNSEINLQADKIETLYKLAMPNGECGGTQQQIIVLRSWIRKMKAIQEHLEETGRHSILEIGDLASNNIKDQP